MGALHPYFKASSKIKDSTKQSLVELTGPNRQLSPVGRDVHIQERLVTMQLRKLLMVGALFTAVATISSGCAYRTDLAQGNFVEQDAVDQLRQGMSAAQVQYILGTPMLTDPFDNSRWYYVHYLRQGWDDPEIKNLVVVFEGNTLSDIAGDFEKPTSFYDGTQNIQKINFGQQ